MQTTRLMILSATFAMAIFNGGCTTDLGRRVTLSCPPLIEYSQTTQQQAADEIRSGKTRTLAAMVKDYKKMRDACRLQ